MTTKKTDADLAKYFQDHRDDDQEWEMVSEPNSDVRPASIVYSVRFKPMELAELRRAAANRRESLSELIRGSALRHVRETDTAPFEFVAQKITVNSRQASARVGTRGQQGSYVPKFSAEVTVTV